MGVGLGANCIPAGGWVVVWVLGRVEVLEMSGRESILFIFWSVLD